MKLLILAPHPDDEVLGCGGTIAKLAQAGHDIFVAIVTKGYPPLFNKKEIVKGQKEAILANKILQTKKIFFCDLPAAELDVTEHRIINQEIMELFAKVEPDWLFIPFLGDLHLDHQNVFLSSLVAARPNHSHFPKKILAYETLSETNWNAPYLTPGFQPNVFFDISEFLEVKLQAFACYQTQIKNFPHERSLTAMKALAQLRGASNFCEAAEAFVLIREFIK